MVFAVYSGKDTQTVADDADGRRTTADPSVSLLFLRGTTGIGEYLRHNIGDSALRDTRQAA